MKEGNVSSKLKVIFFGLYLPPTRLPSLSNTAIPSRISFHRINGKLTQLAPATAANGTNRPIMGGNFDTAAEKMIYTIKAVLDKKS